jgi:hypothetical protein
MEPALQAKLLRVCRNASFVESAAKISLALTSG